MSKKNLTDQYLGIIDKNPTLAGTDVIKQYLSSTGGVVPCSLAPKVLDAKAYATLAQAGETFGQILDKLVAGVCRRADLRRQFGLDGALDRLVVTPSGYARRVPLMRLDTFFDESTGDVRIVGVNAEVVEGLSLTSRLARAQAATPASRELGKKAGVLRAYDLVRQIVWATLETYGTWANAGEGLNHPTSPSLAIVAYADTPLRAGIETCLARFREVGVYAHFTDIRDLRIENLKGGARLVDSSGPLSCVLRACKAGEMARRDCAGVQALVEAARKGYTCLIPDMGTLVCSTKTLFPMLRSDACRELFTPEERAFFEEHVPETHLLGPDSDISQFYDREGWVIKTADGVSRGVDTSDRAWRVGLVRGIKHHDVVQAYAPRKESVAVVADGDALRKLPAKDIYGLYVFNGRLCGVGVRTDTAESKLANACLVVE